MINGKWEILAPMVRSLDGVCGAFNVNAEMHKSNDFKVVVD